MINNSLFSEKTCLYRADENDRNRSNMFNVRDFIQKYLRVCHTNYRQKSSVEA